MGKQELSEKGIDTPYLDAAVLLAEALSFSKEHLFSLLPDNIPEQGYQRYRTLLNQRLSGLPVSYIRKKKEFFGLEFFVDSRVLVPRPDTETLVEAVNSLLEHNPGITSVHDVCTGSGCIAVTLKHLHPELYVTASDISDSALEVFVFNARKLLRNEIPWYKSDLLKAVPGQYSIICGNPPYLTEDEVNEMKISGWPEPETALRAGPAGMNVIKRLITEARGSLYPKGYLVMEAASSQIGEMKKLMEKAHYTDILIEQDLGARDRVIIGKKGSPE